MNLTLPQKSTKFDISQLINEAREAEASRDLVRHQAILKPIWENIELEPNFSEYNDLQKAELYRLSGYFISFYGKSKSLQQYQERAKNLLTNSIELFLQLKLRDKAAEARVILALCYFYEGAIVESESILEETIDEYDNYHLHPVYLKSSINRMVLLHWKSEFQTALEIIREIEVPVEFCNDKRLIYMFHIQAGMIYRGIQKYDQAIYHYNKSIKTAQEIDNWATVAVNHNNLAFLYKNTKDFASAHQHVEIAIQIFRELNQVGWIPHVLDTKALIYFAENNFALSLQTFDEAIELLQKGEDYAVLIDAMWNKVRCYLALHQKEEAILLFAQLANLAQTQIGEVAVKKYTKLFTDIIYIKQDNSLENEVKRFKKLEIINALSKTDYNIEEAAVTLGYTSTNKLIKLLNSEFPELYDEIGIQPRINQPKIKKVKRVSNEHPANDNLFAPKLINQLQLRNVQFAFDKSINIKSKTNIKTFYCSPEIMKELFDISYDAIIAIEPFTQMIADVPVLIRKFSTNDYSVARIFHDKNLHVFMLMDEDTPYTFDEAEVIGKPVGYCSFEEADSDNLFFKPLPSSLTASVSI